jgi:dipeptide/tripeptide permease
VAGVMMGFWFMGTSLGNFFAGWIASFADRYPLYRLFTIDFLCLRQARLGWRC